MASLLLTGLTFVFFFPVNSADAADVSIASPDQLSTDVTFSKAGTFTLQFSSHDGEVSASTTLTVTVTFPTAGMEVETGFRMYPNPAREMLTLELPGLPEQMISVRIYSLTGSIVLNREIHTEGRTWISAVWMQEYTLWLFSPES